MTEKEAWLKIGDEYETLSNPTIGLCVRIRAFPTRMNPLKAAMRNRLFLFAPHPGDVWYWNADNRKQTRAFRATACCFLAAMCDG